MPRPVPPLGHLTEREQEVARLMAQGRTNGEIADSLGITFNTAKWHVSQVIARLGVTTREEAVAAWRRERSARRRLHCALTGLSLPVLGIGIASVGAAVAGIVIVAVAVTIGSGTDPEAPASLVEAVSTATTAAVSTPSPTATPTLPPGCPIGTTVNASAGVDRCPSEYYDGFAGANASGSCNLSGRDLAGTFAPNIDLAGCDLSGANLASIMANTANLAGADLSGADLHGGSFYGADLEGANLTGAILAPAIFQNANLRKATLEGATIADTHFGGATWGDTICPDGTNSDDNDGTCVGTGGIVVSPYVLGGFSREPSTPAVLHSLDLGNCTFDGLDLRGIGLVRLNLGNCSFAGANLAGITIRGSTLGGVDLSGANVDGTRFLSVDLTRANLTGVTGQPILDHVIWNETTCPNGHTSGALGDPDQTCEAVSTLEP